MTSLARTRASELDIEEAVSSATRALLERQQLDGHWVFELEADATIPAEYVMLEHFLDEIDEPLEAKIAVYLRRIQNPDGGWPLFYKGDSDVSTSVKAYYALKLVGDDPAAPHMLRARDCILALGGAARGNVFMRLALTIFGQTPWRAVPVMPVELMLLPRWFPFHLDKISYWSRTVVVPLLIMTALRARAKNPRGVGVRELFVTPPELERHYNRAASPSPLGRGFVAFDRLLGIVDPIVPKAIRSRAIAAAVKFTTERLNGEDGLGAIFPAMVNSVMAFTALGYRKDHPDLVIAKRSVRNLVVESETEAYCQPCVSPVWDTSLTAHALLEAGDALHEPRDARTRSAIAAANDWLRDRQVLRVFGDWAAQRPGLRPGGWAFQYWNDHYPDVDDTAVVAMAMHRDDPVRYREAIARAEEWVAGMQSRNGGWGAFDAENDHYKLNEIPFADHGALLDPPTEDVSARCVGFLLQIGRALDDPTVARGIDFLRDAQQPDGSWYGRWGTNYVYGTWSVLTAFMAAGETTRNSATVRRGAAYLLRMQGDDGGWGEDGATYFAERRGLSKESTASQTAWALIGLMNAGEAHHPAVARGVKFLLERQTADGLWDEPWFTAVGFPRVFYLRYHGYRAYFPALALARYRRLVELGEPLPALGF